MIFVLFSFTHDHWLEMMANCSMSGEFSTANTEQDNPCSLTLDEAMQEVESQPPYNPSAASPPGDVDSWSYVKTDHSGVLRPSQSLLLLLSLLIISFTTL